MANPSRLEKIQITDNVTSTTATKVNVQEANGEVNTQSINTAFNKNFGLNSGDVVGATTLLNQYSATPTDWTAQTYTLGSVVFYGEKQWLSKSATVAGDVPSVSSKWEEMTFESLANKTITVDAIPTDGSDNAVSSNGVFDALALKADISQLHNPVTIGTANGLSLSTQQISLGLASSGVTGALSGTDWNVFNGKFNTPSGLTINFLPKWNGSGFGNSAVFDNGSNVGIGTNLPIGALEVKHNGANLAGLVIRSTSTDSGRIRYYSNNVAKWDLGGTENRFFIESRVTGNTAMSIDESSGNTLFGTTTDNGVDKVQVNGTISASPAVSPNQVVVKSQLDAVAGTSGSYTPTVSASTNCVSPSALLSTYTKNGNIGNVIKGRCTATVSAVSIGVDASFYFSLPQSRSYMSTSYICGNGTRFINNVITNGITYVNSINTGMFYFKVTGAIGNSDIISFNFQYDITQ